MGNKSIHKIKFLGLIILFFGLFSILYSYQIAPIFKMKHEIENFDSSNISQVTSQVETLKKQLKEINQFLLSSGIENGTQQQLIKDINNYTDSSSISLRTNELSDVFYNESDGYVSSIFFIELSGNYIDFVKLSNYIEKHIKYVKIMALHFKTETNYKSKSKILYGKFYMQSVTKL